jgi:hypothetical protein
MKRVSISYLDKTSLLQENVAIKCIKNYFTMFFCFFSILWWNAYPYMSTIKDGHNSLLKYHILHP